MIQTNNTPLSVYHNAGTQCSPWLPSPHSPKARGKTWDRFTRNCFQSNISFQEWLTATKLFSQNNLRSTSKILIAGLKPTQPALHTQTNTAGSPGPALSYTHFPDRWRTVHAQALARLGDTDLEIASSKSILQVVSCEEFSALDFTQQCWFNHKILG